MSLFWKPEPLLSTAHYTIQNKKASSNEFYVAMALDECNLDYEFQRIIAGGWSRAGGQIIDFIVDTKPLPTPLEVNGNYWHREPSHEIFQADSIRVALGPGYADLVIIWGSESDTQDHALSAVRRLFIL